MKHEDIAIPALLSHVICQADAIRYKAILARVALFVIEIDSSEGVEAIHEQIHRLRFPIQVFRSPEDAAKDPIRLSYPWICNALVILGVVVSKLVQSAYIERLSRSGRFLGRV